MSGYLWCLLVAQQATWSVAPVVATVGDTIVIERTLPAAAGWSGRTRPLEASDLLEPLGPPEIAARVGALVVRFRVAVFTPGRHPIGMPSVELLGPDGSVETVFGDTAVIDVVSVIPAAEAEPDPRFSRAPIPRAVRRIEPLAGLLAVVIGAMALWGFARRRVAPRPRALDDGGDVVEPPLERWLAAGEARAVASVAVDRLRGAIERAVPQAGRTLGLDPCLAVVADARPEWPLRELEEVLRALERARFAPLVPDDAVALTERVDRWIVQLAEEPVV
ncbi:MAG TPA: hypothetical protein VGA37_13305 [Gemmatimonadales bacterium]